MQKQRAPPQGYEYVIIQWRIGAPPPEILFQASLCGLVKGNEPALSEFLTANDEAVCSDVLKPERDCLRHSEPHTRQQGEKSAVGMPPEGFPFTQRRGGPENTLDFLPGKNVGHDFRGTFARRSLHHEIPPTVFAEFDHRPGLLRSSNLAHP